MQIVECPFFPGKLCFGTCPNNEHNFQELVNQSNDAGLAVEEIITSNRVDPNRFIMARIKANSDDGFLLECESNLVQ